MPQLPFEQTHVQFDKSIREISLMLEDIGADGFMHRWVKTEKGRQVDIGFRLDGVEYLFPMRLDTIESYMERNHRGWPEERIKKQAERTAGRQIKEQIRVVFAMAKMKMATVSELLLAYATVMTKDGGQVRIGELITAEKLLAAQDTPLMIEDKT
jgi:hypothetical protein